MKTIFTSIIFSLLPALIFAQPAKENPRVLKDIIYKNVNGWAGKMDLYLPLQKTKNALVFYIHGGGWTQGSKADEYEKIKVFIENGFAVANVEYRLAKQAPAPAAVEDVHCALVYLLKHAKKNHIDPKKVVLIGASAGGHLALLLGLQSVDPVFDKDCQFPDIKIAGIISKYGPTDLMTWVPARRSNSASSSWLGDRINDTAFIHSLSPVSYVSPRVRQIPVLFVHGKKDKTVPIQQAEVLYQKLKQNGNDTRFFTVANGGHGNFDSSANRKMDREMIDFVRRCIK